MSSSATMEATPPATARFAPDAIRALRELDNSTNIKYIAGNWLVIALTVGLGVLCFQGFLAGDIAFWWMIPVIVGAALIIGAAQHQLGAIIHEGTHFLLFKDRYLNEAVGDWTAGFALYTSTHSFRLHHFAHHQFVNDPKRDPNFEQAHESGYWLDFPVDHVELLKGVIRLMWPVSLVKYMVARAKQSAIGTETNPFAKPDAMGDPWAVRAGILFAVVAPLIAVVLVALGYNSVAILFLLAAWAAVVLYYALIPDADYPESKINPVISLRVTSISRMSFLAIVYLALTITETVTGAPAWGYYGLFWILPLFTAFPVYMILREWVQHGNADRGRYTNTRVFLVDPLSRYAVFPLGMDYHLPHHLFVGVPHYKLKRLHELLLNNPEYREKCRVVDGWAGANGCPNGSRNGSRGPSIVDVLGPQYAVATDDVHINEETIAAADINDKVGVAAQVAASRGTALGGD